MTDLVMQYPRHREPARGAGSARPSISLSGKQFAFRPVSRANPEELLGSPIAFGAPGRIF
jgi:hypothetical protein